MEKRVIVFAPHPDDEILGCGGTIARKIDEGYEIFIVYLTDGRNVLRDLGIFSNPSPLEIKEIRKKEAKKATKIIGIPPKNLIFLDIEDGMLKKHQKLAQTKITEILKNYPVEIYFPQEREYNIDHRITNMLVKKVIKTINFNPYVYKYIIAWIYPFNIISHIYPDNFKHKVISIFTRQDIIQNDISDYIKIKKKALKKYQSQLSIVSSKQKSPALKKSFLKNFLNNKETFFIS